MPKTDPDRIAELERRVAGLEKEAKRFRQLIEAKLLPNLEEIVKIADGRIPLGAIGGIASLGDLTMSLGDRILGDEEEDENRDPVRVLGDLGLPPVEKRARGGRIRKGR